MATRSSEGLLLTRGVCGGGEVGSINVYVTKVPIGFLQVDGLLDEQGRYYMAVPQLADY
ncbi:MAG: hypothetical protein KME55_42075 [Nostoc indistinguendum CM1-VF10]|nr:hypothetical protein [Nostoc indistinguendum CM1-VF10]